MIWKNSTTTSFAIVTARRSRRRWRSWSATWSSLRLFRSRSAGSPNEKPCVINSHLICFQLVDQNSALKKEAGIAERKLLARNERIQNLETLLQDADRRLAVQNQKFEAQLQAVKERLDQARGMYLWLDGNHTLTSFGSSKSCCTWFTEFRADS